MKRAGGTIGGLSQFLRHGEHCVEKSLNCRKNGTVPLTPANGCRAGFSLLEVILALAVLAGSIAVLGEASRQALRNAEVARDLAQAQLLAESKMAEIVTGIVPAAPTEAAAFDATTTDSIDPDAPGWLYSVETQPTDEDGLISVRVTVSRDLPAARRPVRFSLVRWIPDPNATEEAEEPDV